VKPSIHAKDIPKSRNSHTASVIGSTIWLFGGHNKEHCFNDVHVFDTRKKYRSRLLSVNCDIFCDLWSEMCLCLLSIHPLRPADKRRWSTPHVKGTPPTARYGHSAAVVGEQIFIMGGHQDNDSKRLTNDVYVLDVGTLSLSFYV
jgi:N-acetylneuraminic acid mutarotase